MIFWEAWKLYEIHIFIFIIKLYWHIVNTHLFKYFIGCFTLLTAKISSFWTKHRTIYYLAFTEKLFRKKSPALNDHQVLSKVALEKSRFIFFLPSLWIPFLLLSSIICSHQGNKDCQYSFAIRVAFELQESRHLVFVHFSKA